MYTYIYSIDNFIKKIINYACDTKVGINFGFTTTEPLKKQFYRFIYKRVVCQDKCKQNSKSRLSIGIN